MPWSFMSLIWIFVTRFELSHLIYFQSHESDPVQPRESEFVMLFFRRSNTAASSERTKPDKDRNMKRKTRLKTTEPIFSKRQEPARK